MNKYECYRVINIKIGMNFKMGPQLQIFIGGGMDRCLLLCVYEG